MEVESYPGLAPEGAVAMSAEVELA